MRSVHQNDFGGVAVCELEERRVQSASIALVPHARRIPFRALRLLALVLILRPLGNVCLAWGMKHFPQALSANPLPYLSAMLNPYVAVGITALILATLTRMALLSLADLSFVLPLTATGYIFSTLLGRFLLSEQVSVARWAGTALIFIGTALVGSTAHKTPVREKLPEASLGVTLP
jgi:drug/metabolite transporter (DMT)-like permease